MRLTILGSGTMMPTQKRAPAAYLLESGSTRLLLDCGSLALARLVDRHVPLKELEAVCITHFHTDHFSNLFPLVHALWVDNRMSKRQDVPLTIIGPGTLEARWKKLKEVYWPEPQESFPITFVEGPTTTTVGTLEIEAFDVKHVPWFPSVGYRISHGGKTLVYTGDIGSDHPLGDLIERARGVDLLLVESGTTKPSPNHFTIQQILKVQEEAKAKRVLATHIREQNLPVISSAVQGRPDVGIAEDGMTVEL